MAKHNELGAEGENLAAEYIGLKGYVVLERNWRKSRKEIDILAKDGDTLVVIEVKSRSSNRFGEPESFVKREKQKNTIEAANLYIEESGMDIETRFDIITVVKTNMGPEINHIKDAF